MTQLSITNHRFDLERGTSEFAKNVIRLCKQLHQNVINRGPIGQSVDVSASYYWLERLQEANFEYKEKIDKLLREALELKRIFSSLADKSFYTQRHQSYERTSFLRRQESRRRPCESREPVS